MKNPSLISFVYLELSCIVLWIQPIESLCEIDELSDVTEQECKHWEDTNLWDVVALI